MLPSQIAEVKDQFEEKKERVKQIEGRFKEVEKQMAQLKADVRRAFLLPRRLSVSFAPMDGWMD